VTRLKLVMIEWLDSHAGRGWDDIEDIKESGYAVCSTGHKM